MKERVTEATIPPPTSTGSAYDPAAVEEKWYRFWEENGFFHADPHAVNSGEKRSFVIPMPPPNVTGRLHMGHALQDTVQDVLVRMKRMQGFEVLWIPGIDHAGIATQNVVERELKKQGLDRKELGREAFVEKVREWKEEYGDIILQQKRALGASCDWRYQRFTMDEGMNRAVNNVFVTLHEQGLIYRGNYLVNWDPDNQTAISNEEVENVEQDGHLWYVRYPVVDAEGNDTDEAIVIATTRPETIPADTGVAVHPDDERFQHLVGKRVRVPATGTEGGRVVPVVADEAIKMEFGAGALKVTPAHDETDFEIGKRHGLDVLNIMNPDASLNKNAGRYDGLDRFEAREAVVKDLEENGHMLKVEDYRHSVPISSRSKTLIEPLLSLQWYVRMEPLAKEALEAVRDGRVTFHPARWANEYFRWLDNIRDWPISRQLWWGHRIPVWYYTANDGEIDEEREPVVSVDQPEPGMVQDEDVLDTWFSSWLWPFATLGWPKSDAEQDSDLFAASWDTTQVGMAGPQALKAFYPGSVLVSGYDILFFWIARMIMSGLHFTGEAPYRDVFITGMIKDKLGRWMSKSLGNGVDPLDMIEQYGADAVRYTLAVLCTPGQDIKLNPARFEGGRNFANKVWNAFNVFGRFIETDEAGLPTNTLERQRDFGGLELYERWMLTRVVRTTEAIDSAMGRYRISEAAQLIYDLVWRDFCDWYLELAKPAPGETMTDEHIALSIDIFEDLLRLLHPFMPFLTEELWWKLRPRNSQDALITAGWVDTSSQPTDDEAARSFELVQEVVSGIRSIRSRYNVPPSKTTNATVSASDDASETLLQSVSDVIQRLARVETLDVGTSLEKPPASAAEVVGRNEVFVPLEGIIDLGEERAKLGNEIKNKQNFLRSVEKKLENENFIRRAPAAVVDKERQKAADARTEIEALETNLKDLG